MNEGSMIKSKLTNFEDKNIVTLKIVSGFFRKKDLTSWFK
jgi:hypothetical protein